MKLFIASTIRIERNVWKKSSALDLNLQRGFN